jgi:hypothetical protein
MEDDEIDDNREGWDNKWQYLMAVISYAGMCTSAHVPQCLCVQSDLATFGVSHIYVNRTAAVLFSSPT